MQELELLRTLILSAPNFAGLIIAIYYMARLSTRLLDIVEKCDCGDKNENEGQETRQIRANQSLPEA